MKRIIVIVMAFQLLLAFAPLSRQAAALDRNPDSESLEAIGRELSAYSGNCKKTIRVKVNREAMIRDRGHVDTRPGRQQTDLLGELLAVEDIRDVVELEAAVHLQHY